MFAVIDSSNSQTLINQVASLPENLSSSSPESILVIQAYLEQQQKINQIAKRLSAYTLKGQKLEKSSNINNQLELRKHQIELENFVEDYIDNKNIDINSLTSSEGLKQLMFARLAKSCEAVYTFSMNNDKDMTKKAKKAAEEAKKDFNNISSLLS